MRRVKPRLIIGSPRCSQFSQVQHLDDRVWNARRADLLKEAKEHVFSAVQIYREQMEQGGFFLARTHSHSKIVANAGGTYVVHKNKECIPRWRTNVSMAWSPRGVGGGDSQLASKRTRFLYRPRGN